LLASSGPHVKLSTTDPSHQEKPLSERVKAIRTRLSERIERDEHRDEDFRKWRSEGSFDLRDAWASMCPKTKEEVSQWQLDEIVDLIRTGGEVALVYMGREEQYNIRQIQNSTLDLYGAGVSEADELNAIQIKKLLSEMQIDADPKDVEPKIVQPKGNEKSFFISSITWKGTTYPCPEGYRYHRPKDLGKAKAAPKKNTMPAPIFQGVFQPKRSADCMVRHNGLYTLDFDDVGDIGKAEKALRALPCIFLDYVSISGTGIKAVVYGPVVGSAREYSKNYERVVKLVAGKCDLKTVADDQTKDCSRLSYLAYDPDLYVNWDATPLTQGELDAIADEPVAQDEAKPAKTRHKSAPARTVASRGSNNGREPLDIVWKKAGEIPDKNWTDTDGKAIPLARVLDALRYCDPVDRESWRTAGAALKLAYGEEAFPFWGLWSSSAGDAYGGTEDCQRVWDSHDRAEGEHVSTPLSIFRRAREAGWRPPSERVNDDDFDDPATVKDAEKDMPDFFAITTMDEVIANDGKTPDWIIEELLPVGGLATISGRAKSYKSWVALDLCLSMADGKDWLGFKTRRGCTVYVNFELSAQTLQSRIKMIADAKEIDLKQLEQRFLPLTIDGAGLLCECSKIRLTELFTSFATEQIKRAVERTGLESPILLVIDSFYNIIGTQNENAAADVAAVYRMIRTLAKQLQCAVTIIHHFAKGAPGDKMDGDRAAGSRVHRQEPNTYIELTPHKEQGAVVFSADLRDYPHVPKYCLRWDVPLMVDAFDLSADDIQQPLRRGRKPEHSVDDILSLLRPKGMTTTEWMVAADEAGISNSSFHRLRKRAEIARMIEKNDAKKWLKTA
jgi:hypothetical protein